MKIAIAGTGYVGISKAILLAQHNKVVEFDIDPEKIEMLNHKLLPIEEAKIKDCPANKTLYFKLRSKRRNSFTPEQ